MDDESYNLQEVAEMLGISRRALHKRLREGVFPNRFLAQGRHGLETRIPAREVEAALHELHRRSAPRPQPGSSLPTVFRSPHPEVAEDEPETDTPSILPVPRAESLPQRVDIERLREVLLQVVREDREQMVRALRGALATRDDELQALRTQMVEVHRAVERLRERIEGWELTFARAPQVEGPTAATALPSGAEEDLVDQLLRELAELEGLVESRS